MASLLASSSRAARDDQCTSGPEEGEEEEDDDVFVSSAGEPLSAVAVWLRPRPLLDRLRRAEPPDYRIDEFGFRVEEEDGPEQSSSKLLSTPFAESPKHRCGAVPSGLVWLQWIAHLEFTHNSETAPMSWENMAPVLPRTDKLRAMVRGGVPHSLRPQIWLRMSGALRKKLQADMSYAEIVKVSSCDSLMCNRQIEKDLLRTLPSNVCFSSLSSPGVPRLRHVLRALAWLYPDIGYCQGMGMIVANLLLFMDEEEAFWLTATVIEDLLPASYYSSTLLGIQADQRVLSALIATYLPDLSALLEQHDIELSLITLNWFLTVFASVLHVRILLRVWDLFFYHGSLVVFQVALGMLRMKEEELCKLDNSADIFNALSDLPGTIDDVEKLLEVSFHVSSSLTEVVVESHRRRHLAFLMNDQGTLMASPSRVANLPKQQVNRPQQVDPCERPVDETERVRTAAAGAVLVDAACLCSAVQLEPRPAGALFEPGDWRREAERAAPRQEVVRRLTLTSSLPPPAAHERRYVEELRPAGGAAPLPGPDRRHRARVTRYSRGRARHETSVVYVLGLNLSTWCCVPAGRLVGSLRSNPDFPLLSRRAWASISAALVKYGETRRRAQGR
ncbi:Small G protein signaling modulator 3 [Amphibalanus amphitrite]|uniref:Small G protein signaling modulator 3 n=1 Tax=Amphibalanus amphitrite TaxID=1232801 RepID=A0A6A4WJT3_AMPAM|nr:Small G protein signaling modulator 3 [Amphibalanus amphitrite]